MTTITADIVSGLRAAKRISREDFERWEWDEEAAARVRAAHAAYRHYRVVSEIDDPVGLDKRGG